jgi:hypothetical protein
MTRQRLSDTEVALAMVAIISDALGLQSRRPFVLYQEALAALSQFFVFNDFNPLWKVANQTVL